MNTTTRAYLAGLVDGEGCISVTRSKSTWSKYGFSYRASICITMTDRSLLAWCMANTGLGTLVSKKPTNLKHKQAWAWQVWSRESASFAKIILPFLILKKPQAQELIKFQSRMRQPGRVGLTIKERSNQESTYKKFRSMNFRGV